MPAEEIIQATEPAIRRLPKTAADDIRLEVSRALAKHKPPKTNLTGQELKALRDLRRDQSIHILTADKGNATVVMDREDYNRKVRDILESGAYRPLTKDPTPAIEKRMNAKPLALQRAGN